MAYNPQHGSLSAKPYAPSQAVPTDMRSYYYDEALFVYRPYQSVSEVLTYLNQAKYRTGQFSIFVCSGTLNADGTFTGGTISEYWFKDGTEDADLVLKTVPAVARPADVDTVVVDSGAATDQFVVGEASATFAAFVGYNVRLFRNYQLQGRRTDAPTYYSYDSTTGTFTVYPSPVDTSETFQIQAQ